MRSHEDPHARGDYPGQHDPPTCDFCGADAVTTVHGEPRCGRHSGLADELHP